MKVKKNKKGTPLTWMAPNFPARAFPVPLIWKLRDKIDKKLLIKLPDLNPYMFDKDEAMPDVDWIEEIRLALMQEGFESKFNNIEHLAEHLNTIPR